MEIRLDQIVDEPFEWSETRTIPIDSLDSSQLVALSEISWGGTVSPLESGHLFKAKLKYEQDLECPRCLKTVKRSVASEVELLAMPRQEEPMTGELELGEEDLGILYLREPVLDTEPVLLEQLQLNIPMRQLCREDCAGLCPKCGVDLNEKTCECVTDEPDSRWTALAALKDRLTD